LTILFPQFYFTNKIGGIVAEKVCPVWIGYLLMNPLRKLLQNPNKILGKYVKNGMTVLDIGCAMGYFSLPLANMVGSDGKVICVDVQEKMIKSLKKRAQKAGLSDRIETVVCSPDSLRISEYKKEIDFALAFAVVHEVLDVSNLFVEVNEVMKLSGRLLVAEPRRHVSEKDFALTVSIAEQKGFIKIETPKIHGSHVVLLEKKTGDQSNAPTVHHIGEN